ncbi:hypothetical protein BGW38_001895 [Lunasporangiospora selenospora]|uniref:VOC domain-containing protein n=1 Tax=Lunasporangiospora selenospora TaxID=979761 RepID=A0A9P6KDW5_9FUNG|nr:hypothetical protein BGW38_001895 [Lunasporangiospora selenospora]
MTKRLSDPTLQASDVDMISTDAGASPKKTKVSHDTKEQVDAYTISSPFLKDSRFEILYMATRARAETPRLLLEFVGAKYTSAAPVDWPASKTDTPFGLLPLLTHLKPDGSVFTLSETASINRYLAGLFELDGETLEEKAIVDTCYQCANDNVLNTFMSEVWVKGDFNNKENLDKAFEKIQPFLDGVERYLVKNGSNGYFVGSKTTYADLEWYEWIDHFATSYEDRQESMCSETNRPALFKLYTRLKQNSRLKAYAEGGRWEFRPTEPLLSLYSTGVVTENWERSFEFYTKTCGMECVFNKESVMCGEGARYMEFVVNSQEKTKFTVFCFGKSPKPCAESGKANADISFTVRSVQETHDRLVKKGVEFKMPPTKVPWGYMAQFLDPDGNLLTINSATSFDSEA